MQDERDRRIGRRIVLVTSLEPSLRAAEDHFWHRLPSGTQPRNRRGADEGADGRGQLHDPHISRLEPVTSLPFPKLDQFSQANYIP